MMFLRSIALWLLFIAFLSVIPAWAVKPQAPIRLTLSDLDGAGDQRRLVLRATAALDADALELSLNLPPDIVRLEGPDKWSGPLRKGEVKTLEVIVQVPSHPLRQVVGKAIMTTAFGTFIRQSRLALDHPSPSPPALPPPQRRDHAGNVLEFKGK
jgi:hypothetical protein